MPRYTAKPKARSGTNMVVKNEPEENLELTNYEADDDLESTPLQGSDDDDIQTATTVGPGNTRAAHPTVGNMRLTGASIAEYFNPLNGEAGPSKPEFWRKGAVKGASASSSERETPPVSSDIETRERTPEQTGSTSHLITAATGTFATSPEPMDTDDVHAALRAAREEIDTLRSELEELKNVKGDLAAEREARTEPVAGLQQGLTAARVNHKIALEVKEEELTEHAEHDRPSVRHRQVTSDLAKATASLATVKKEVAELQTLLAEHTTALEAMTTQLVQKYNVPQSTTDEPPAQHATSTTTPEATATEHAEAHQQRKNGLEIIQQRVAQLRIDTTGTIDRLQATLATAQQDVQQQNKTIQDLQRAVAKRTAELDNAKREVERLEDEQLASSFERSVLGVERHVLKVGSVRDESTIKFLTHENEMLKRDKAALERKLRTQQRDLASSQSELYELHRRHTRSL